MPRTPADRAHAKQRVIKHGDYRGHIWGDLMDVYHKNDPSTPVQRLVDESTKERRGDIVEWPADALRYFVEAVGKEHSAGNLPPFENTPRPESLETPPETEQEKNAPLAPVYDITSRSK